MGFRRTENSSGTPGDFNLVLPLLHTYSGALSERKTVCFQLGPWKIDSRNERSKGREDFQKGKRSGQIFIARSSFQFFTQSRESFSDLVIPNSNTQCLFCTHNYHQFSRPGHSSIQEIALKEHVVRNMDGHDHNRILASLGLMN